ncbi:hypothetical protein STEG23_038221, partial [Scotinomys teguina]
MLEDREGGMLQCKDIRALDAVAAVVAAVDAVAAVAAAVDAVAAVVAAVDAVVAVVAAAVAVANSLVAVANLLQDIIRNRKHPLYITHIRSHTGLPGPLAQ